MSSNQKSNSNGFIGRYSAEDFDILEGLEAIRVDTNMYVNSVGVDGILQLLVECIDNVIDESKVLNGFRRVTCDVKLLPDGTALVRDNGRGIPVDVNKKFNKPAVYISFEHLHGGAKLKNNTGSQYDDSIGVHGIGLACVNALSEKLIVRIKRDGKVYSCEYSKGKRTKDLYVIGDCDVDDTGTEIEFKYDNSIMKLTDSILGNVDYPFSISGLKEKLEKYALFNKNVEIFLDYNLGEPEEVNEVEEGGEDDSYVVDDVTRETDRKGYIIYSAEKYNIRDILSKASNDGFITELYDENEEIGYKIRTYLTVTEFEQSIKMSAVNGLYVREGGVHEEALKNRLCEYVLEMFQTRGLLDSTCPLLPSEILQKVSYVIELASRDSAFTAQVKNAFNSPEIGSAISNYYQIVFQKLDKKFLNNLTKQIKSFYDNKVEYLRDAKEKSEQRKPVISVKEQRTLFENFFDCESNRKNKTEIWIFEGDSAANGFKDRDTEYQAYMKLCGKLINTAKASPEKIKANKQFRLFQAIYNKNKFGRYVLCADADVDGKHICSLFLKMIVDWFPSLVEEGKFYVAVAPLYKMSYRNKIVYAATDREKDALQEKGARIISRFKGIGGMDSKEFYKLVVEDRSRQIKVTYNSLMKPLLYGEAAKDMDVNNRDFVDMMMGNDTFLRKSIVLNNFCDLRLRNYMKEKRRIIKGQRTYFDPLQEEIEEEGWENKEYGDDWDSYIDVEQR